MEKTHLFWEVIVFGFEIAYLKLNAYPNKKNV